MEYYSDEYYSEEDGEYSEEDDYDEYYDPIFEMKWYMQTESDSDFSFFSYLSTDDIIVTIKDYEYKYFTSCRDVSYDLILINQLKELGELVLGRGNSNHLDDSDYSSLYNQLKDSSIRPFRRYAM